MTELEKRKSISNLNGWFASKPIVPSHTIRTWLVRWYLHCYALSALILRWNMQYSMWPVPKYLHYSASVDPSVVWFFYMFLWPRSLDGSPCPPIQDLFESQSFMIQLSLCQINISWSIFQVPCSFTLALLF